jgi:hypothetical protein
MKLVRCEGICFIWNTVIRVYMKVEITITLQQIPALFFIYDEVIGFLN